MRNNARRSVVLLLCLLLAIPGQLVQAQTLPLLPYDPGVRGGPPDAGGPIVGISTDELEFFNSTADTFGEVDDIDEGLGPRFNLDGCAGCHAQPAVGGTSPDKNPQVAMASKNGARNKVPAFITPTGPVREARFKSDGGVHDLFVITGRTDAPPGCAITQPDFDTAARTGDLIFRIPTPTFGAGLIEAIPDRTIRANQSAYAADKSALGISGRPNQRQRWHDHPLRVESAEQVAADLLWRGLQRRAGRHQRALPDRTRRGHRVRDARAARRPHPLRCRDGNRSAIRCGAVLDLHALSCASETGHRSDPGGADRERSADLQPRRLRVREERARSKRSPPPAGRCSAPEPVVCCSSARRCGSPAVARAPSAT